MTLKVTKPKYKIRHYFIGSNLIFFQFLRTNISKYRYFSTYRSTFIKNSKRWKILYF